jgi:Icc-related predicted phosphoesterase
MRTLIISDVHIEFYNNCSILMGLPDADCIVVAGDMSVCASAADNLGVLAEKYKHVVYVAGNHDYYHCGPADVELAKKACRIRGVHWLENQSVTIEGIRFVGCTLWFEDGPFNFVMSRRLNDFGCIGGFVPWVYERNAASIKYLKCAGRKGDIIITHHAPSLQSAAVEHKADELNIFYYSKQAEQVIVSRKPKLWIHGHMHARADYSLHDTRVVCNAFGYPHQCTTWKPLILDL